jgi:MFS transporter, FSR family, fosmidomycin resistance protein
MTDAVRRVWSLSAAHLITDIYTPVLPAVLPLLIIQSGYSYLLAGLLVTAYNITSSMTQPAIGWLFDRRGKGIHVSYSLLMSACGMALIGIATEYYLIAVLAIIAAVGHAAFHPSALGSVGALCTDKNRGRLMSYFIVGGNLGYAIGPLLVGALIALFGLPGILFFLIPGLTMAAVSWYALPPDPARCPVEAARKEEGAAQRPSIFPISILIAASALRAWAIFAVIAFLPTYLVHRGFDVFVANALVSVMLVAGVGGQIMGGTLSDRYGRKEFTLTGMILAVPAFLVFIGTGGLLSLGAMLVFGFLLWSTFAVTVAMAQELMPKQLGLASGLTLGLAVGAGGIGVAVTGIIADLFTLEVALATLPFPIVVSVLLFYILPYPWKLLGRKKILAAPSR